MSERRGEHALILGVNGQDGSYLAESLIRRGWKVSGIGRQASPAPFLPHSVKYVSLDLADTPTFEARLTEMSPDAVFHAAAVHGPAGFAYENVWKQAHAVNTICAQATLEYARRRNPKLKFFYFSSSKVFGDLAGRMIDEKSPRVSNCIYTITKNCATELVQHYRRQFGVPAATLWFFHHESPRRRSGYFIPKLLEHLSKAKADRGYRAQVRSLEFISDWGDAREFMEMLAEIAEHGFGRDLVFATGRSILARSLASDLFAQHGLNYAQHLVEEEPPAPPPTPWSVDVTELTRAHGSAPAKSILETCNDMLAPLSSNATSELAS